METIAKYGYHLRPYPDLSKALRIGYGIDSLNI